ncbi:HalOD1 output domain-containing protein [Halorussus litoreus]|uniref:HalOD1 output domain-containing protein n=1 Tax=Halorussus litoreus TaxID=1710536 RepID=UPI001300BDF9|nr:HalOD1 output domain-containing protein [Halorussus litoreus]
MSQSLSGESVEEPSTSQLVIEAVSEATGSDPTEVGPLYHVIDPDALDRLFAGTPGRTRVGGRVEFTFAGCDVVVRGDGEVEASEREALAGVGDTPENEGTRAGSSYEVR